VGSFSVLSGVRTKHLILEGENLEAFPSRNVIRVTTTHAKKGLLIEAVEEAVKGVRKKRLALGTLYPTFLGTPTGTKLRDWVQKTFDDECLQELSRMSGTSISREIKHRVIECIVCDIKLTCADFHFFCWQQVGLFAIQK
jgi:hypothetical protein